MSQNRRIGREAGNQKLSQNCGLLENRATILPGTLTLSLSQGERGLVTMRNNLTLSLRERAG